MTNNFDVTLSLHQIFVYTFAVLALPANLLLLTLIAHPTSKNLGHYRVLLCTFAVMDMAISMYHAGIIPVFVQTEFGYAMVPFKSVHLPPHIGFRIIELYCVFFYEPFILLIFHFFYRLMSVTRANELQTHFWKGAAVVLLINLSLAVMIIWAVRLIYPTNHEHFFAEVLMREYGIDVCAEPEPVFFAVNYVHAPGFGSGPNWGPITAMLVCGSLGTATFLFNIVCGIFILRAVKERAMSDTFRNMQVQLLRALVVQFSVPMLFCVFPFFLIVGLPATGISFGRAGDVMGLIVSSFPVFDPICVIIAYSRFRAIITGYFRRHATAVGDDTRVTTLPASSFVTTAVTQDTAV